MGIMDQFHDMQRARRTLRDFEITLGDCTFAPRGQMISIPAEQGEEIRRALETVRIMTDGETFLVSDDVQENVRHALWGMSHEIMDSIAEAVAEAIEEVAKR